MQRAVQADVVTENQASALPPALASKTTGVGLDTALCSILSHNDA